MRELTPQQKDVLDFIVAELQVGKQVPSIAEIAEHIGVKCGANPVMDKLRRLQHYGYIFIPPRADKRSLQVHRLSDGTICDPPLQAPPAVLRKHLTPARLQLLREAHTLGSSDWPDYGGARRPYEWCEREGLVKQRPGPACSTVVVLTARGKQLASKLFS